VRRFGFCDLHDYLEPFFKVSCALKLGQAPSQGERLFLEVNHLFQLLVGNFYSVV
jgi:hypothetical protein